MNHTETCFLYRNCMVIYSDQYKHVMTYITRSFCAFEKISAE